MASRLPSVMGHQFSQVPQPIIGRSSFDRDHGLKTAFNGGEFVPIFIDEVVPGDTFNAQLTLFGRLATPIHPFMDNLKLDTFFFFVPSRLVWDNWEKLCGAQENPSDTTDYLVPQITAPVGGFAEGSLYDYLGIPTKVDNLKVNALPLRGINLIYNVWVRDQNLQDSKPVPMGDGPDDPALYELYKRGKRHDYFTSGLPWPQKGPDVTIPLTGNAPVQGLYVYDGSQTPGVYNGMTDSQSTGINNVTGYDATVVKNFIETATGDAGSLLNVRADLSDVASVTINAFREAVGVQQIYEADARGGTRYTELLRAHYGVINPDLRLQRPEYLGGGSYNVSVNPIAQTSATDATTPQGNLAAMGTVSGQTRWSQSFMEYGFVLGFASLRADLGYQQGLHKMWSRRTRFDHYWPALANLGEQAVSLGEIYAQGTLDDDLVFNYQERWAEYRYKPTLATGRFRSNATQSLDSWHLMQNFDSAPVFNEEFIEDNPPIDRVTAVANEPDLILDTYMKLRCARPMPLYSVPGLRRI